MIVDNILNIKAVFLLFLTFSNLNDVIKGDCRFRKNYNRLANLQQPGLIRAYSMLSWQKCETVPELNG